jgi:hypothetical protein
MATTQTIQAIKKDIEGNGSSLVPFKTIEHVLGQCYADDDDFEAAVDALVASKVWVTGYEIGWKDRIVLFTGPWSEPDH